MTRAVLILKKAGIPFKIHTYQPDPDAASYGMDAAMALGVPPERLFKTLIILLDDEREAVAILPVSARLDLKAAAACLKAKHAFMASPEIARRVTGYEIGGISPFGQRKSLPVILDEAALGHETFLVSAGRRGVQMEIRPRDLMQFCRALPGKISR